MAFDRSKSFPISEDGISIESGVWVSSGPAAPVHSANKGDRFLQTNGDEFRNVSVPSPGTSWFKIVEGANGAASSFTLSYSDQNDSTLFSASTSYKVMSEFMFPGTTETGIPSKIELVAGSATASFGADFKIFDRTNSLTIAEVLNHISLIRVILNMGTLSNLPAGAAIFEIQGRKPAPGQKAEMSALRMKF